MKTFKCLMIFLLITTGFAVQAQVNGSLRLPDHPRLLCLQGQEESILSMVKTDENWNKVHLFILKDCDAMLTLPTLERIKIGRRLLDVSRECLRRVFYLSYAYRTTHREIYLKRAEKEMLAVSAFTDWNPSHFLDVSEMTMAVALGYDWLYNDLPESSRKSISDAILHKGIEPSLDAANTSWLTRANNWNQVCNAGMAYGAMATYKDHPELSINIINRAIETLSVPMKQYVPDGTYPEGYSYWEYGTTFNVMLISALDVAYGNNFGLSEKPGFMKTASFMQNIVGPSGNPFNFSDCGARAQFNPAMFWFANKLKDPSLLWVASQELKSNMSLYNRLLPAVMIWGKGIRFDKIAAPKARMWVGKGVNQIATFRTSWTDPNALFVGFKGGSPSLSHAHMDAGSFVMEADGVKWAMDFGMQDYESLESKGVDLWNSTQNSPRWKVFRYNNLAHNTITINNEFQKVKGSASITSYSTKPTFMNAIADLTELYQGMLNKATRGVAIIDQQYVAIRDEFETGADSITVRWSMATPAEVKITGKNTAELTKNGKKLLLKVQEPGNISLKTWSTAPTTDYDAPNPGTIIVGFEVKLPANAKQALSVLLVPQKAIDKTGQKMRPLSVWPK